MHDLADIAAHDALHDELERLVRENGPTGIDWLVRRARGALKDARIDDDVVDHVVSTSTLLVWRPDDSVDHLLHVLDGSILTQRARAPLAGRPDLWCTVALQPLLAILTFTALPLADGSGEVRAPRNGQNVMVGPTGWLPDVPRFGVVGIRIEDGKLSTEMIDEATFPNLPTQEQLRQLLARHYRIERWYSGQDDVQTRPGEMISALGAGLLEDPDLLAQPLPPLDELLYLSLEQDCDVHYWRDRAAWLDGTVSFYVNNMPEELHGELHKRAQKNGMSFDQYVVAILGHLAWRTPFADDLGPWETWDPERSGSVTPLRPV